MTTTLGYPAIDSDNHYYETRDCFTRYIEPAWRDKAIRVRRVDGQEHVFVGGERFTLLPARFDQTVPPGALREWLKSKTQADHGSDVDVPMRPEWQDRDARLALMDAHGLEAVIMLPTLGVHMEPPMRGDVGQTYANLCAFNRWIEDEWGYAYRNRIFAVPMLSLLDVDRGVEELERVLALGARIVHLRPGPVWGRSPADPHFDPFWARVEEARVPVAFHIGGAGYIDLYSKDWGEAPDARSDDLSAFQWAAYYCDRPIMDTLMALILNNLFGRFPKLRVASIENGSSWVAYLLYAMDKYKGMARTGRSLGGKVKQRPSEIFRDHVYVSPYHEENLVELATRIGPDRVLFGSDYPHPEGLAVPIDFAEGLAGMKPGEVRRIMRGNAAELLCLH